MSIDTELMHGLGNCPVMQGDRKETQRLPSSFPGAVVNWCTITRPEKGGRGEEVAAALDICENRGSGQAPVPPAQLDMSLDCARSRSDLQHS